MVLSVGARASPCVPFMMTGAYSMRTALATSTCGIVVARLLRLPFVPICGIARRSLDHMVGSVCGCGELCLGVTWRRLYDERIVVDVYIGGSVDV